MSFGVRKQENAVVVVYRPLTDRRAKQTKLLHIHMHCQYGLQESYLIRNGELPSDPLS